MRMRMTIVLLVILCLFGLSCAPLPAHADEQWSGNKYLAVCDNIHGKPKDECLVYLWGYLSGFYMTKSLFLSAAHFDVTNEAVISKANPPPCFPEGTTMPQLYDVLIDYLHAHPENRQNNIGLLLWIALSKAWPCNATVPPEKVDDKLALRSYIDAMDLQPKSMCLGSLCFYWKQEAHAPTPP